LIGSGFALIALALPTIDSYALHSPTGILRNQETMQDQEQVQFFDNDDSLQKAELIT